ncbi:hypothetical protein DUNSADRAFT_741, partial [Dunaliella salina]
MAVIDLATYAPQPISSSPLSPQLHPNCGFSLRLGCNCHHQALCITTLVTLSGQSPSGLPEVICCGCIFHIPTVVGICSILQEHQDTSTLSYLNASRMAFEAFTENNKTPFYSPEWSVGCLSLTNGRRLQHEVAAQAVTCLHNAVKQFIHAPYKDLMMPTTAVRNVVYRKE